MPYFYYLLISSLALSPIAISDTFSDQVKMLTQDPMPKVFGSVMNERPRMLTIQLDSHHAVAYDTSGCQLGMAWKVESGPLVNFDAAVYTGKHGPQPKTLGTMVFENMDNEFSSPLGKIAYLGHAFRNGNIVLRYGLKDSSHKIIATIEELPQWSGKVLSRSINVSPAAIGPKISFKPCINATWRMGDRTFTKSNLAQLLTITTTL